MTSNMKKTLVSFILGIVILSLTSTAAGQSSTAARAERLAKLEEDLNSPDPNMRLAALEVALESKSLAMRKKAISLALLSSDREVSSLAMRYYFCQNSTIRLVHSPAAGDRFRGNSYDPLRSGVQSFMMQNCDPYKGTFSTIANPGIRRREESGRMGSFAVNNVNINFALPSMRWDCSARLAVDPEKNFSGTMACQSGGRNFGPVAARIIM